MRKPVILEIRDNLALVTLNRPDKRNALNKELLTLLCETIEKISNDDHIKASIITGKGLAFCSGIDLDAIKTEMLLDPIAKSMKLPDLMATCKKPIIGAINGVAMTGGLEIALNCDFLIASSKASFIDTHARVGIHPGWGITQLLQQAIGQRRAKQMSFTCQSISAHTAYEWGLVNEIVPHKQLINRALEIGHEFCKNEPELLLKIKNLIENTNRMSQEDSVALEKKGFENFVKLTFRTQ